MKGILTTIRAVKKQSRLPHRNELSVIKKVQTEAEKSLTTSEKRAVEEAALFQIFNSIMWRLLKPVRSAN